MTRVAFIGGGWIARSIAEGVDAAGASLIAVADPNESVAARWASRPGVQAFSNYVDLLGETQPEVVFVLTPTEFHAQPTIDALEAGADVVVEKPMASSIDEATAMIEAADRASRRLLVDESYLFMPSHEAAIEVVRSLRIGAVRTVVMTFYGWLPLPEFRAAVAAANEGWRSAGTYPWLTDHAVHFFAWSRRLAGGGDITDVRALGGVREDEVTGATWRCGAVSVVWLRITHGLEGVLGSLTGLHTQVVGEQGYFTVLGEGGAWGDGGPRGAIRFDDSSTLTVADAPDVLWEADVGYYPSAHLRSVQEALAATRGSGGGYAARLARDDLVATQALISAASRL